MAVEAYFEAKTVWMSDTDKSANIAITQNWGIPNLGDLKKINVNEVEPIDILTAGYPCQPFSQAGHRKGKEDERHLWPYIKKVISDFRPRIVILENVRGHLSLGFKEVLADLAELGFSIRWGIVRASDVGAPHQRARLFVVAYSNGQAYFESRREPRGFRRETEKEFDRPDRQEYRGGSAYDVKCTDTDRQRQSLGTNDSGSTGNQGKSQFESALVGAISSDTDHQQLPSNWKVQKLGRRFDSRFEMSLRAVPNPLDDGKLNTKYVEYMMGLPEGWVTKLPISRAQQFKLLGNGVVPQQAYHALIKLGA